MTATRNVSVALLLGAMLAAEAHSATVSAGSAIYTYDNTFFTRLFPGTPFNPGSVAVDVPVTAQGTFTQAWEAQSGDTIVDELTSIVAAGTINGVPPVPFELFAGIDEVPELGAFTGSMSSIVNDPISGELISAFRSVSGPFLQVLADGTRLYAIDPYTFVASVDSLPFGVGDIFVGTQNVAARVQLGPTIDPANDPIIGLVLAGGVLEITSIVPEPASGCLAALTAACLAARGRRSE
ncbi:hypothetical protein [Botrimarina sp.]|uniref:hypothetical protein n=1 Tax=Botrimarina sp. TaxID=2795802 RepID=UPI0032EB1275